MSTENILLFSVFIVIYTYIYKKRCKQSVKTRLQRFLVYGLYRCPAKEPDSDIGIYALFSRLLVRVVGHVAAVSLHAVVLFA